MPLFPNDPRYALESARAYAAEGKQDKVREITDDLLQRYQNNADVLVAVGNFWRETLPLAEARARLSSLAEGSRPRIRSVLADQLIDNIEAFVRGVPRNLIVYPAG